jgi:predicted DNA-binding transcriptional regulator YafY
MPKRPQANETLLMAHEILSRLSRHRAITASELHLQLKEAGYNRDLRSIQRTLRSLAENKQIDVDTRDKPYSYRADAGASALVVSHMNHQQSLLLALAEQQLGGLLPPNLRKSMQNFFTEARRNLAPDKGVSKDAQWLSKVRVVRESQPLLPPSIKEGVLEAIGSALYSDSYLDIEYRNLNAEVKTAKVMPLGLVQQGACLYLVCRFDGYDNERNLAVHRFMSARPTGLPFTRPRDFDLQKYDDDGRFGFGKGVKVRLSFEIKKSSGEHLLEAKLSQDQSVEDLGDWYRFTATVVDTLRLAWWLRGFGERVQNIEKVPLVTSN